VKGFKPQLWTSACSWVTTGLSQASALHARGETHVTLLPVTTALQTEGSRRGWPHLRSHCWDSYS
jgi:hypothetical protein